MTALEVRANGPEGTAIPMAAASTAAQVPKNQRLLQRQAGWRWSFTIVPQKGFTVLAVAKRFGAAGAVRGRPAHTLPYARHS